MPADVSAAGRIADAGRAFLKAQGVSQWQKGNYPSVANFAADAVSGIGYVLELGGVVAAVCAVTSTPELSYAEIDGNWLTSGTFYFTVHRSAVAPELRGQGVLGKLLDEICDMAGRDCIASVRIDTH